MGPVRSVTLSCHSGWTESPNRVLTTVLYRLVASAASLLGLTTVSLFVYVLLLPWITGEEPDVRHSCFFSPAEARDVER